MLKLSEKRQWSHTLYSIRSYTLHEYYGCIFCVGRQRKYLVFFWLRHIDMLIVK